MIERIATRTAQTLYALVIVAGVLWLAWLCLSHLPLWGAVLAFCLGLPLLAMAAAPLAAVGAGLAGLLAGLVVLILGAVARPARHDD